MIFDSLKLTRPKLLSITSQVPWPLNSGGHLRTYHLQHALGRNLDVELVYPRDRRQSPALPDEANFQFSGFDVSPRSLVSEACRIGLAQVKRCPYSMYFRHHRKQLKRQWSRLVSTSRPDIVWLDHVDSYLYLPSLEHSAKVVIDLHNIYSLILRRLAKESRGALRRRALNVEAARMEQVERQVCQTVDAVIAVSDEEGDYFRQLGARQVHVAPNGVDCDGVKMVGRRPIGEHPQILFVGAMDWHPNVSSAISLATEIFPQVQNRWPHAQLNLVGKSPVDSVKQLGQLPGVNVTGTVPEIAPYLESASLFAVPLDSGGGTRLKILEAFAAGVPVVSTAVGAEGIEALDGVHLRLASRDCMAETMLDLLNHPDQGSSLANAARTLVEARYDWRAIGERTFEFLQSA